eukprot:CAMPEP_0181256792 /NCGR_PEP_ID=MMETSP1096-20121128/49899_1 /TAXON_ID=156174 ORGANISM="Chrysochromulina ericina, Strain CCMP281" /NCGR_SAMPLE_ID=MMETSP1096 /ASSEMBLY_ACC=CAM_ASM_000453 /LENGTH=64 /DNA_ID=CAMNT_0023355065 /DNA_START=424 /DNA_END=615 /DNA_ORIENTATION=+
MTAWALTRRRPGQLLLSFTHLQQLRVPLLFDEFGRAQRPPPTPHRLHRESRAELRLIPLRILFR